MQKLREGESQRREDAGARKGRKVPMHFGFAEGQKVGSVRSQLARGDLKNYTPLWREAHLEVRMCKSPELRTTFGS